jgi:small GTP-binding protein
MIRVEVGKSCILNQFINGTYKPAGLTIGVDAALKTVKIGEKEIQVNVWDTAGQERFHCIARNFYRYSHAVLLVYDISDYSSFIAIKGWIQELHQVSGPFYLFLILLFHSEFNL